MFSLFLVKRQIRGLVLACLNLQERKVWFFFFSSFFLMIFSNFVFSKILLCVWKNSVINQETIFCFVV